MKKKAIVLITIVCILTALFTVQMYAGGNTINDNTIITESNLNEALIYCGILADNFIPSENLNAEVITTGQLKTAMLKAKYIKPLKQEAIDLKQPVTESRDQVDTYSSGTVMLYTEVDCDGYVVEYSVSGFYSGSKWTGSGGAWASIDSPDIGFVRKIDKKEMKVTLINNNETLRLNAKLEIGVYLGLKWGLVKTGQFQTMTTRRDWDCPAGNLE